MADNMDLQIRIVGEDDTSGSFSAIDRSLGDLQRLADEVSQSFESFSRSISGVFGDAGRSVSELTRPLQEIGTEAGTAERALSNMTRPLQEIGTEAHTAEQSLNDMLRPLFDNHAESAASEIARSLESVGTAARDATRQVEAMDEAISRPVSSGGAHGGAGGAGGHGSETGMGALFGNEMQNNAMYAGMAMGSMALPLVGALKVSTDAYGQFSQAMANVNSMMGLSAPQLDNMSNKVLELSKNVPDGPVALANALYGIVGAGVPAADQMAVLTTASKAATAGQTDVGTATNALIAVMNSYGMSGKDVAKISDQMFAANAAGAMTFDSFARSIGNVAGPAAQAGVGFDQVAAATAALTNQGMTAQRATQGLRALLVGIMAPTSGATKEAKKLGISWDENTLKSKGMVGMLQEAMKATGGNSQELKKLIPNIAAWTVAVDLGGKGANSFKQAMDTMGKSAGSTDKAMEEQKKGFQEQMKEMQNSMQTAEIAFAKGFIPVLTDVASKIASIAEWFSKLSPGTQKLIGEITLGAAAFLTLGASFFMAISGIGALVSGFTGIANALKLVTGAETLMEALSPVGWVLAIIAAVVTVSVLIYQHWGQIKAFLTNTWNSTVSLAKQVWGSITSFFSGLWSSVSGFFVSAWTSIQNKAVQIWNGIVNFFKGIYNSLRNDVRAFVEGYQNGFTQMQTKAETWAAWMGNAFYHIIHDPINWVKDFAHAFVEGYQNGFTKMQTATETFAAWLGNAFYTMVHLPETILTAFESFISKTWSAIQSGATIAWTAIVNGIVASFNWMYNHNYYFQDLVDFIRKAWATITKDAQATWTAITQFLSQSWSTISTTAQRVWGSMTNFFSKTWNDVSRTAQSVWNSISNFFSDNTKKTTSTVQKGWDDSSSKLKSGWNSTASAGKATWNSFSSTMQSIWSRISSTTSSAWNSITSTLSSLWHSAVSQGQSIWNSFSSFLSGLWRSISSTVSSIWSTINSTMSSLSRSAVSSVESIFSSMGSFFSGLAGQAFQWGSNLINMVGNGIKSAAGAVKNAVSSVAQSIASVLGFHSPAKEGPAGKGESDKWMENMMNMFATDIQRNSPKVKAAVNQVALGIKTGLTMPLSQNMVNNMALPSASNGGGGVIINVYASGNITRNERELGDIVSRALLDKTKMQGKF